MLPLGVRFWAKQRSTFGGLAIRHWAGAGQVISSSLELDEVLQIITQKTAELLQANHISYCYHISHCHYISYCTIIGHNTDCPGPPMAGLVLAVLGRAAGAWHSPWPTWRKWAGGACDPRTKSGGLRDADAFGMSSIGFRVLASEGWVFGMGWMGG